MMRRGNNRGRGGNFGGPGNPRGGGGARGGGNADGPLLTNHLRDLDMELDLLKRKREIFEQEQIMLDRMANNTSNYSSGNSTQYPSSSNHYPPNTNYSNNSNRRQYDNKQPFNTYNQQGSYNQQGGYNEQGSYNQQGTYNQQGSEEFNFANVSSSYQPGPRPSNFTSKPQGFKRQAGQVWQNPNPTPPKRFNAPQSINPSPKRFNAPSINPWQNPNARQAEFRAVNQNPPQPKNFSAQTRALMAQKPGIGQRIKNKYNPPPERKNFKPNKVFKPNQKPVAKAPVYRPSVETKKLIEETNKLIAHTNKLVGQSAKPKGRNPPSQAQNPSPKVTNNQPRSQNKYTKKLSLDQDNILRPYRQPSVQVKGRLELAVGMIMKSIKELCPDEGTLDYFNIPFMQRVIKHTLRGRIRDVMMNKPVVNLKDIVDKYREKYPLVTDLELMKIAQDAHEYNNNQRVKHLIEADNPEQFFKKNIGKVLHNKFCDMFDDLQKLYEKKDTINVEELAESFLPAPKENNNKDTPEGNENGVKDLSGEIDTSGEKDTQEEMDSTWEGDTSGVEDIDGEKVTDGAENKDGTEDANKITSDEKEQDTDDNAVVEKDKSDKNTEHTATSSKDIKSIECKSEKSKKYLEFMEKLIEQKLPLALCRFKEEFLYILCLDKEFVRMKALIDLETKLKLRKSAESVIILDDDEETRAKSNPATPTKSATAGKPATPAATSKPAATASKSAAPSPSSAKPVVAPTTPAKSAATAAKPVAPSTTPKPVAPSTTPKPATPTQAAKPATPKPAASSTAAKPATPVKPATTTTAAKSATPVKPAATATPVKPSTAAGKPAAPPKADENSGPTTPKTPASKNIQYVKLIGRPALPARAVIYEFLNQFSPTSIKKHKSISNLLVIGFTDKEGFDKILTANESVVGDATITIKASEQVSTPVHNKTPQQGNKTPAHNKENELNKTNDQENDKNDETPAQTDPNKGITQTNENILNSSADDIIPIDLDSQISDLLSSIRKADEEEKNDPNVPDEPKDVEVMDTTNIDEVDLTKEEETDKNEKEESDNNKETVEEIEEVDAEESTTEDKGDDAKESTTEDKEDDAKESITEDSNTVTIDLDTIMEDDEETTKAGNIKAKAVEEVAKTAKESGRATPTRSSSRLANVTPSTIKTRRASRLANNN
ncbi:proteoglycan 4-like [Maniola jurtina]|uniref:proteoglycan 4-like n=1 Tax=Maniola jurtina TaxID=191418 RepID=UPI001E68C4D7|nr:proteoglycan 4-like [Maniola jurtina]